MFPVFVARLQQRFRDTVKQLTRVRKILSALAVAVASPAKVASSDATPTFDLPARS